MITNALILSTLIVALLTKSDNRKPVLIFIVPAVLFQVASLIGLVPADSFHLIAMVLDLAVIIMLIAWTKTRLMPLFIGGISVISIFANALGWIAYEHHDSAVVYDWCYVTIYAVVLFVSSMEWLSGAGAGLSNMPFRSNSH